MKVILASAFFALVITTPAAAQDFYLQGEIGGDYYPSNSIDDEDFDVSPGATIGGRIGADFQVARVEVGAAFSAAVVDFESDPGSNDADYYQFALQAGAYKDFGTFFYAGGGAGFVYQEISAEIAGTGVEVEDSETNFVAHGELGLNLHINDEVAIVPHYRLTWLPGFNTDDEVFQHSLRLGVRFGL